MNTICLFGDSIGKGVVLDAIRGRYLLLKNSFANILNRTGINIKNYSKFGCTVTAGKSIVEKNLNNIGSYKYTILEYGGNDCDFDWESISKDPQGQHTPKTELPVFEKCYEDIISEVIASGSQPVLLSLPPLDPKRYFSWISRDRNSSNILKWLGDIEHIYHWHEMYNLAVTRLAIKMQVPLLDVRSAFLKTLDYSKLLCEDGIHPNESGHNLISGIIQSYFAKADFQF